MKDTNEVVNARKVAFNILLKVEQDRAYSNLELNATLNNTRLENNDKALVTRIVYGVIGQTLRLDYILSFYLKNPIEKMDKEVRVILRMGVYQIEFMDKIPPHALVNESVNLTKMIKKTWAGGFVNGVLRSIIRDDKKVTYPKDKLKFLSTYYSYPVWLCKRLSDVYKEKVNDILWAGNNPPPVCVRVNELVISRTDFLNKYDGVGVKEGELSPYSVIFDSGFSYALDKGYINGEYYPQDEASMKVAEVLDPCEGQVVIDMCAAPGGKTTHIATLMKNKGEIYACDIFPHKLELIEKTANRLKINIIETHLQDATVQNGEFVGMADKVLADVPCSGLGIIRRKPEIKWERTQKDIDQLVKLQKAIISNAATYLKYGGELVYSTCSIEPKENIEVVLWFLEQNSEFSLIDINKYIKTDNMGYVQLLPGDYNADGFFIAKLRRKEQ